MEEQQDDNKPLLTRDFSVEWLVYHATYTGDYLAAVDLGPGRDYTYREFYDRI